MILIHGDKNQGKTTQLKRVIDLLKSNNKTVAGFYSEKISKNNIVLGYDLLTISKNVKTPFLNINTSLEKETIGVFSINNSAIEIGNSEIEKAILKNVDYIVLDEVGKLELNNKGWYNSINKLLFNFSNEIIFCVRTEFVQSIIEKFNLKKVVLIETSEKDISNILNSTVVKS